MKSFKQACKDRIYCFPQVVETDFSNIRRIQKNSIITGGYNNG
jgi:hypothetical protein